MAPEVPSRYSSNTTVQLTSNGTKKPRSPSTILPEQPNSLLVRFRPISQPSAAEGVPPSREWSKRTSRRASIPGFGTFQHCISVHLTRGFGTFGGRRHRWAGASLTRVQRRAEDANTEGPTRLLGQCGQRHATGKSVENTLGCAIRLATPGPDVSGDAFGEHALFGRHPDEIGRRCLPDDRTK